jgi:glycosyltransferase involved in cell wall biosynthesis
MKIAIDTSPLQNANKIRGVGFYLENLKKSLLKNFPDNDYLFFNQLSEIPTAVDLVHYPYFDPFFTTLPLFKKYKTVVTVHDLTPLMFPNHFPAGLKGNLKWQIQRYNLHRVDRVIVDSECSKNDVIKIAGVSPDKIDVVYLAAGNEFQRLKTEDLRLKKNDLREKYKLPEKFVLYVGDATWNKNLPRLINAVNRINIPLVMVGKTLTETNYDKSNPWNQDLHLAQELITKSPNIKALGFVSGEDLIALYNLAAVFVMPSLYEGFGLPILEAMQSGCPVITSKKGSLPEVAGDAAIYVDAQNIDSIAEGISKAFEDAKLQDELIRKGLTQAGKFSWKKTAADTLKAYQRVLSIKK